MLVCVIRARRPEHYMTTQQHAHLPRPVHKEPPAHAPNAALLIDFDNVTMGIRSDLQTELKRLLQSEIIRGKVAVQRAYADWRRYPQYIVPLSESSIDLIFAPAYGSNKKNATDIRLAIDALELVFTRPEIGTFILLSGDSDFSSLVLKLKEYGKYVIGVGIRESSSDLLIQNCDEYYAYNELAGLTKESDVSHVRRDPWELVVEAVKQMTAHNDVMRSDRLKQVMQEIDPTFNEKDIGFSRFSKFVVEAARRDLIHLKKLDNGQYEISLGPGVPGAAAQPGAASPSRPEAPREERPRRAPEGARREAGRRRATGSGGGGGGGGGGSGGFSLSDGFNLITQALRRLGGGERPVSADELRDTVIELRGQAAEPLDPERFPKLLRQAHDAEIIDLSKEEDGAYTVKLRRDEAPAEVAWEEGEQGEVAPTTPLAPTASAGVPSPSASPSASPSPNAATAPPAAPIAVPSRSARFRRGSRGPRVAVAPPEIPKVGVVEVDPNFKPRIELVPVKPAVEMPRAEPGRVAEGEGARERRDRGDRGGRGRGGRGRGGRGGRERSDPQAPSADLGPREDQDERGERGGRRRRGGRGRGSHGGEAEMREQPDSRPERAVSEPPPPPAPASDTDAETEPQSFWSKVKRGLTGGA
jgi:uncharacterized protein (TIGR00288 family)